MEKNEMVIGGKWNLIFGEKKRIRPYLGVLINIFFFFKQFMNLKWKGVRGAKI